MTQILHPSVLAAYHAYSEPLEGRVSSMYLDVKGLITVGVGNLINTPDTAVAVKGWVIDGRPATDREVREDWMALRSEDDRRLRTGERSLRKLHWKYAAPYTRVRLPDEAIDALVESKLHQFVAHMVKHHFPDMASWPADAQLGTCSMAWACGPGFPLTFKNFAKAAKAQDWLGCEASCNLKSDGNPGVIPRNRQAKLCFRNAAAVKLARSDVRVLHWPAECVLNPYSETEAPTEPAVPHPGPAPTPLAGGFSVAEAIVRDALKGR